MQVQKLKFFYFILMSLVCFICLVKFLLCLQVNADNDFINSFFIWLGLSCISFLGAFFSYKQSFIEKKRRSFGQVFALSSDSNQLFTNRKNISKKNIFWRRLLTRNKKIIRILFICLSWVIFTVTLSAIWSVFASSKPWPAYKEVELGYLFLGVFLIAVMGIGVVLDKSWAGRVGYTFAFLQMLWFPVGLLTGLLMMLLIGKVVKKPIQLKLKRNDEWQRRKKRKQKFAQQKKINETLSFELDKKND